jgi:hypothetical protein
VAGVEPAGQPSFRYALPATPVATASADIDHVSIKVELRLFGELEIVANTLRPPSDARAARACTLKALRAMAKGLMVSGISSYAPSIASSAGHRFVQSGYQFRAPDTMAFAGACEIGFGQQCECGTVHVAGDARYSLDVAATPAGGRGHDSAGPAAAGAWFLRHEQELASIGMVVLVAVPIAPGRLVAHDGA